MTELTVQEHEQILTESNDKLSTLQLQLDSLNEFMYWLGYDPNNPKQENDVYGQYGFAKIAPGFEDCTEYMSLQDAVRLHNDPKLMREASGRWVVPPSKYLNLPSNFYYYLDGLAECRKVQYVSLIYSKKKKEWKVNCDWVLFENNTLNYQMKIENFYKNGLGKVNESDYFSRF